MAVEGIGPCGEPTIIFINGHGIKLLSKICGYNHRLMLISALVREISFAVDND